jgi:FMN phosphatase YigB (HAD superfamily)
MADIFVERGIRCLLFDLGDTLWYRESQESWDRLESASNQQAIDLLRQQIEPALLPHLDDPALGQALRQAFDTQVRATIRKEPLLEPDATLAVACVLQEWGLRGVDRSLCTALFEALRVRIPHSRPLFPDTLSTLAQIRQRGYLLGIVTNRLWGGKPFHDDLRSLGLLEYVDIAHMAISGDLGLRKPHPRIFESVLHALDVPPGEAAMIGDSLSADILGADPLGIYTIWKPKPWLSQWAKEHAISLAELPASALAPLAGGAFPGEDTADMQIAQPLDAPGPLPAGMYVTDDDYILARAFTGRDYPAQFHRGQIRPDRIITHLAELLEIFPGVRHS